MKILCFSDLHSHNYQAYSKRLANGRNSRFQIVLDIIDQACKVIVDEKIDYCFFLGDMFHSRTKIDIEVYSETYLAFTKLAGLCPTWILMGNHDSADKSGTIHSLEPFGVFAKVITTPYVYTITDPETKQLISVACSPWTADIPTRQQWLKSLGPCDLLLFHQGLSEATVGPYDAHVKCELSVKDFPLDRIKLAIGGDFHKPQILMNGQVRYCGSPFQLDFGERHDTKAFSVIETETWTVSTIETKAPKFFQISADQLDRDGNYPGCDYKTDYVRLQYGADSSEKANRIRDQYPSVQLELSGTGPTESQSRLDRSTLANDRQLINAFVKQSKTTLDQEKLASVGLSLLLGEDQ